MNAELRLRASQFRFNDVRNSLVPKRSVLCFELFDRQLAAHHRIVRLARRCTFGQPKERSQAECMAGNGIDFERQADIELRPPTGMRESFSQPAGTSEEVDDENLLQE